MAFNLPTFNLLCDIWHNSGVIPPVGAPDVADVPCQIAKDGLVPLRGTNALVWMMDFIRMPALTDVRMTLQPGTPDIIECPKGSGVYFLVHWVNDIGKGFANEYRQALCMLQGLPTPRP